MRKHTNNFNFYCDDHVKSQLNAIRLPYNINMSSTLRLIVDAGIKHFVEHGFPPDKLKAELPKGKDYHKEYCRNYRKNIMKTVKPGHEECKIYSCCHRGMINYKRLRYWDQRLARASAQ